MSGMGQQASDSQVTPLENAVRLDKASKVIGIMAERVEAAVNEVQEMKKQISDLSSQMIGQVVDTGGLHKDIEDMETVYTTQWQAAGEYRLLLVSLKADEQGAREVIALLEGNEALNVGFEMDGTKPKYNTVAARTAAAAHNLYNDGDYQTSKDILRKCTISVGECKARLERFADISKEYGRRNAAMVSRLDNITAQLNNNL